MDRLFGRNMRQWLGTWLPVQRLVIGDEIVYRKHPFDLFMNTIVPLSAMLVYGM